MESPSSEIDCCPNPLIAVISINPTNCDEFIGGKSKRLDLDTVDLKSTIDLIRTICGTSVDGKIEIDNESLSDSKDDAIGDASDGYHSVDHGTGSGIYDHSSASPLVSLNNDAAKSVGVTSLKPTSDDPHVISWSVDTKYYEADVEFQVVVERSVGTVEFAERVEAVIIHWDGVDNLEPVTSWLPFVKLWEPNTSILVCDQVAGACKAHVNSWCTEHGFELVELNPDSEALAELEEYREKHGAARVRQILSATSWSNIRMKEDESMERNERLRAYLFEELEDAEIGQNSEAMGRSSSHFTAESFVAGSKGAEPSTTTPLSLSKPIATQDSLNETLNKLTIGDSDEALLAVLNEGEDGQEEGISFEQLFAKFDRLKEGAKDMPESERKRYAEKVTIAFWKAIGGDDGEIDLSSDEND